MFVVFRPSKLNPSNRYEKGSKLSGVIYVHRISDNRFGGITGRNFNMFRKLCGESSLKNVILVTNMWKQDSQEINEAREAELSSKFFKLALDKGAQMVRHHNTTQSAHDIVRGIVKNHPVVLQIQLELVDERKDILKTAAGEAVKQEFNEEMRRHQAELKAVREEMKEALKKKHEEAKRELENETKKLEGRIEKIKSDLEGMAWNYAAEKKKMEAKMEEMERNAKREREEAEAKHRRQLADLERQLQGTTKKPAADHARFHQAMKKLQDRIAIPIYE